ncbi:MAG: hypothetical protein D6B25_00780 [Desulfobulbaceae bacterium]|nr:MAG: hypothetical protein D6B25_00780 [Desulfobulbaceae bacterium]
MKPNFKRSIFLVRSWMVAFVLFGVVVSSPAFAEDEWQFHLAPYAWLAGQQGEASVFQGLPPVDIDIDFWDDIAGNINGALFLVGEAQKGPFGVVFDLAYVNIEDDDATPGPLFSRAEVQTEAWMSSLAGKYRLLEQYSSYLDLLAGVRYWSVENTVTLKPGALPGAKASQMKTWVDPIIGVNGLTPLGESRFYVGGSLVIGGFGVSSDFMWDVFVRLGYQWTESLSTIIGYRYLDVDYSDGSYQYEIAQHGPILGLSYRF